MKPILFTFAFAATLAAQNFIQMSDPQFGMFTKDRASNTSLAELEELENRRYWGRQRAQEREWTKVNPYAPLRPNFASWRTQRGRRGRR